MNSFKNVQRALEYEIKRQTEVLNNGGKIEKLILVRAIIVVILM